MKKNKLVLYLFVIFTYSNTFSQDIAGSISINLLFKGDTVRFINKSESKKLRSINKKFILEDISVIKFGFKFPEHMKFPEKKIFQQNRNHILITNRETNDEMHIYIDNIPDRRYYINISFAKGNYFVHYQTRGISKTKKLLKY